MHPITSEMQSRLATEDRHRQAALVRHVATPGTPWRSVVGELLIRAGRALAADRSHAPCRPVVGYVRPTS